MLAKMFTDIRRYTRFGPEDEACLHAFSARAAPHFPAVVEQFYARLDEHEEAKNIFAGPEQRERLKVSLLAWLTGLFEGPWDLGYYERRCRIGRVHVRIALPQHFMFGAMDLIRMALIDVVLGASMPLEEQRALAKAVHKILDIELAIMVQSYHEATVEEVQTRLERELALSEARYDDIVEKAEVLITTSDPQGRILLFNAQCERLTGITRQQAFERDWLALFIRSEDRASVRARHVDALSGQPATPYEGAIEHSATPNACVRWLFTTLPGPEPRLCAIGVDVTGQHEMAVRARRAERLAALGTMAAGLAHEIRNPLNAAHLQLSVAEQCVEQPEELEEAKTAIQLASSEMKRLASLVEDFLRFARPQPLGLAVSDLRKTAELTIALMALEADALGVEVVLVAGEPVVFEFDDEKMKQVLLNLLRNATEAAGKYGHVWVSVNARGGTACLAVEDDGPGFPPDAPIFEPFFTTKKNGTGLGLAIVHRIAADHGGTVDLDQVEGRTVVSVSLPMTGQQA